MKQIAWVVLLLGVATAFGVDRVYCKLNGNTREYAPARVVGGAWLDSDSSTDQATCLKQIRYAHLTGIYCRKNARYAEFAPARVSTAQWLDGSPSTPIDVCVA